MQPEEEIIQELLEGFSKVESNLSPYENYIGFRANAESRLKLPVIQKMEMMELIEIKHVSNGNVYGHIAITPKGRRILADGGYKHYLITLAKQVDEEKQKQQRDKQTIKWAKAAFWCALIIGIVEVLITVLTAKGILKP